MTCRARSVGTQGYTRCVVASGITTASSAGVRDTADIFAAADGDAGRGSAAAGVARTDVARLHRDLLQAHPLVALRQRIVRVRVPLRPTLPDEVAFAGATLARALPCRQAVLAEERRRAHELRLQR